MKVSPVVNSIRFKSNIRNDENIMGFDDEISRERRNYIREHYYEYKMPYQSIYENEPRKTEYQMQSLIKTLLDKPKKVDYTTIMRMPISNVRPIGNNSYRGATLVDNPECMQIVKNAGIKHVIDLCNSNSYKNKVKDAGLDYFGFNMKPYGEENNGFWGQAVFYKDDKDGFIGRFEEKSRDFIDKFVKLVRTLQKGYCYIGCEYGTTATSQALHLINLFDAKGKSMPFIEDMREVEYLRNFHAKLTDKDKRLMGWTKEYDKNFLSHLEKSTKVIMKNMAERERMIRGLF